jgi:hypothetical protein
MINRGAEGDAIAPPPGGSLPEGHRKSSAWRPSLSKTVMAAGVVPTDG